MREWIIENLKVIFALEILNKFEWHNNYIIIFINDEKIKISIEEQPTYKIEFLE